MSVFSLIKRGRQAAKEHKAEQVEKQKAEAAKPSYKHVPTHAAVDAMAGAPSGWREDDRVRIVEANKRRSAMAATGMGSVMGVGMNPVHMGMPRVNSALSHVSYPSMYANPVVSSVPRSYSYTGSILPSWEEHGSEVVYSHPEVSGSSPAVGKGKGVDKAAIMVDSGRASRASSKAASPAGSSSDSTTSQDDLEMRAVRHSKGVSGSAGTSPTLAAATPVSRPAESEHAHRLHPSQARRAPDSPSHDRYYPPRAGYRLSHQNIPARPGSGSRSSTGIPPVPALPAMSGGQFLPSSAASTTSSRPPSLINSSGVSPGVTLTNNSTISVATSPSTPKAPAGARPESPVSPVSAASGSPKSAVSAIAIPEPKFDFEFASTPAATTALRELGPTPRTTKSARFVEEPQPVVANVELRPAVSRDASKTRSMVATSGLPTEFDETALADIRESTPPTAAPVAAQPAGKSGRGKLTKTHQGSANAKPAKKNRWSLRSKSTAVAA